MRRHGLLIILLSQLTLNSFGQESERYQLYSQALNQIFYYYKTQEKRLIILDSTYYTDIELGIIGKYLGNRTQETFNTVGKYYPYPELLQIIWADTAIYHLIKNYNRINSQRYAINENFDTEFKIIMYPYEDREDYEKLYRLYPDRGEWYGLSLPSIKNDKAVFTIQLVQGGGYGSEWVLFICKKINKIWTVDKSIALGGS